MLHIGCSALRAVPHTDALPRHHGADLGPQFLAGVLGVPTVTEQKRTLSVVSRTP